MKDIAIASNKFNNENYCYGDVIAENLLKEIASKGMERYSANLEEDRIYAPAGLIECEYAFTCKTV